MRSGWRGMLAVETIGRIRREHLSKASRSRRSAASFGYRGNTLQRNLHASKEPARFKGTCTRGLDDNLKTAVETGFIGKDRQLNRRFLPMCGHYLVEPTAGAPAAGWEKGPSLPRRRPGSRSRACPGEGRGRAGARALRHAAAAGVELRGAERLAARPMCRLHQGAQASCCAANRVRGARRSG
jgi:hypothetical protein